MNIPLGRMLHRPAVPPSGLAEATIVPLGDSLCAVFLDCEAGGRGRLTGDQDGKPVARPFIAARLPLRSGGMRHVLFLAQEADAVLSRHLVLRLDGAPVAQIDPDWLQPPQDDLSALMAPLSGAGIRGLLRVMLTTGASLFAAQARKGLIRAIPRLMDLGGIPALMPVARTMIDGRVLASYRAPRLARMQALPDAIALGLDRLTPIGTLDCHVEGGLLHVLLPSGLERAQVLAIPGDPLRLAAPGSARRLSVPDWLRGRSGPCRDWLSARTGPGSGTAAAQDMAIGANEVRVAVAHLSTGPAGILHALVLDDPARRVRGVVLDCGGQMVDLVPVPAADGRARAVGLAVMPAPVQPGVPCRIGICCEPGHVRIVAEATLQPHDGSVPPAFAEAWALGGDVLEPLAHARAAFRRTVPAPLVQEFGTRRACGLRIITAIDDSADMIRARAALILAEQHATPVEVVCTMAEGPLALAARQVLAQTAAIYGIPHRLVLLPGHAGAADRLLAALAQAQDAPALILGADVLPGAPGWLGFWLGRLRRCEALAPALLAPDGAIAATRSGRDPLQGLPVARMPAPGRVAGRPLAGCLALGRAGIARLLDGPPPHPDPAIWVAAALGGRARTETRFPFRRLGPAPAPDAFAAALAETEFALIGQSFS